jgi:hypothetical protein
MFRCKMTPPFPPRLAEYCSRGSLLDVLRAGHVSPQAAQQLTWMRRLSMALDAAKGMLCLHAHSPPILHRDLKSPNLLVDAAWRVKVREEANSSFYSCYAVASAVPQGGCCSLCKRGAGPCVPVAPFFSSNQ